MAAPQAEELDQKPATGSIAAQHRQAAATLPFADRQDFDGARRGFLGALEPGVVHSDGRVVWDNDAYGFLDGEAPPTVHPSLWRQSGRSAVQGLFEVVPGIYQIRGLDLSNMTMVEGEGASWSSARWSRRRRRRPRSGSTGSNPETGRSPGCSTPTATPTTSTASSPRRRSSPACSPLSTNRTRTSPSSRPEPVQHGSGRMPWCAPW